MRIVIVRLGRVARLGRSALGRVVKIVGGRIVWVWYSFRLVN